jgi:uncharacterized protein YdcH (DUF465 family)
MENHTQDESLKAHLMASDERYRSLAEQHTKYSRLIDEIETKSRLTPEDELEEHRLKKLKLSVKDQMNQIIAQYKHSSVS